MDIEVCKKAFTQRLFTSGETLRLIKIIGINGKIFFFRCSSICTQSYMTTCAASGVKEGEDFFNVVLNFDSKKCEGSCKLDANRKEERIYIVRS